MITKVTSDGIAINQSSKMDNVFFFQKIHAENEFWKMVRNVRELKVFWDKTIIGVHQNDTISS